MTSNYILVDGLGWYLRIFNLTRWQVCNLKSFLHVSEMTKRSTLATDLFKQVRYSQISSQIIHKSVIWSHFVMFLKWPPMSTLASDLFWLVRLNILKYHPKPSTISYFQPIFGLFSNSSFRHASGSPSLPSPFCDPKTQWQFFLTIFLLLKQAQETSKMW